MAVVVASPVYRVYCQMLVLLSGLWTDSTPGARKTAGRTKALRKKAESCLVLHMDHVLTSLDSSARLAEEVRRALLAEAS